MLSCDYRNLVLFKDNPYLVTKYLLSCDYRKPVLLQDNSYLVAVTTFLYSANKGHSHSKLPPVKTCLISHR